MPFLRAPCLCPHKVFTQSARLIFLCAQGGVSSMAEWLQALFPAFFLCTIMAAYLCFHVHVLHYPLLWNHVVGCTTMLVGALIARGGPFPGAVISTTTVVGLQPASSGENTELMPELQSQTHGNSMWPSLPPSPPGGLSLVASVPCLEQPHEASQLLPSPPRSPSPSPPLASMHPPRCPTQPPPSPPAKPDDRAVRARMSWLAEASQSSREQAITEMRAGQKRSHWCIRRFDHQRPATARALMLCVPHSLSSAGRLTRPQDLVGLSHACRTWRRWQLGMARGRPGKSGRSQRLLCPRRAACWAAAYTTHGPFRPQLARSGRQGPGPLAAAGSRLWPRSCRGVGQRTRRCLQGVGQCDALCRLGAAVRGL